MGSRGQILEIETDADGNLLNEYIFLNGQLLALYQPDDDNDGLSNAEEDQNNTNPANTDSDGDGLTDLDEWYQIGTDARDADSDNDGVIDGAEVSAGTDPLSNTSVPGDGDVNQDGQVNAGDLLLVMQMATGQRIPTAEQLMHADVHTDGVIDVRDVLKLQRRILGLSLQEWFNALPGSERLLALFEQAQQRLGTAIEDIDVDLIDTANAAVTNGKLYYIHTDHLGTPKAMTSETGAKVWSATHDPFGLATVDPSSTVEMNVRYPGQYFDAETGLHYNYYRDYDPGAGRYLESDPIGLDGGINPYIFVNGNPVKFIDSLGLYCLSNSVINAIAGGIGGGFSGAVAGATLASPTGPGAGVGAVIAGGLGGVFGAAFGYFSTSSEGNQIASGLGNAVVTGGGSPLSNAFGGAIAGAVSSNLQTNGLRDSHAGILAGGAGGAGGAVAGGSSAFFSAAAPSSVPAAVSFALKSALKGGLAGLSGAALSAAIAEGLRAGNDCSECQQ